MLIDERDLEEESQRACCHFHGTHRHDEVPRRAIEERIPSE